MEGAITYESDMVKLTIGNYSYKKSMMEDHLICKDLIEPIQNENVPTGKLQMSEHVKSQGSGHH